MRQLASYSLSSGPDSRHPLATTAEVARRVDQWLASKGKSSESSNELALLDGRLAAVDRNTITSLEGSIWELVLTEPTAGGRFRTPISPAQASATLPISFGPLSRPSTLRPPSPRLPPSPVIPRLPASSPPLLFCATPSTA